MHEIPIEAVSRLGAFWRPARPCAAASGGWPAACRSCGRPCRRPRTSSRRGLKLLAGLGNVLEDRQGKAGDGRKIALGRQVACRAGRSSRSALAAPDTSQLPSSRSTKGGSSSTSRSCANAPASAESRRAGRDDAVEMAVFVVNQRQRHVGAAQHRERVHRVHQVGDDRRGLTSCDRGRGRGRRAPAISRSRAWTTPTILSTEPSATGMRLCGVCASAARISSRAAVDVDPVDLGARGHHFAHRAVGEPDDARDDRPLAFLEDAGGLRFGDDQVQVPPPSHGSRFSRLRPSARKMSALVRSSSQTNGAVTFDSQIIGRDMIAAIGSGERKRELLGDELADHQAGEGGDDDDQRRSRASPRSRARCRAGRAAARPACPGRAPE